MAIRFFTLLLCAGAAACFFLPWLNATVGGRTVVSQTGYQVAMGEAEVDMLDTTVEGEDSGDDSEEAGEEAAAGDDTGSWLSQEMMMLVYAGGIGVALLMSLLALGAPKAGLLAGLGGLVAAGVLGYYLYTGFPMEAAYDGGESSAVSQDDDANENESEPIGTRMAGAILGVERAPYLWGSLGASVLIMLFGFAGATGGGGDKKDKAKKKK